MPGCHPNLRLRGASDQGCGISETLKSASPSKDVDLTKGGVYAASVDIKT